MKRICLPALAVLLFFCVSCNRVVEGSGAMRTDTRNVASGFSRIEINAPVDAHISVGGAPGLSFEGFANVLPYLRTEVIHNTLRIYMDENTEIRVDKKTIANISLPTLAGMELSGSGKVRITGAINGPECEIDLSGSGSVEVEEIHVQAFKSALSGSNNLVLRNGDINRADFELSGSGSIKAFGVTQQSTEVSLSGSADAELNVSSKLKISISGSGEVMYKGHPAISQEINGSGRIKDAN